MANHPLYQELSRRFDPSKLVGYLNFSDGRADARFRSTLSAVFGYLLESDKSPSPQFLADWLLSEVEQLEQSGSTAFKDCTQARSVISVALSEFPPAYRKHHRDLLAHQSDEALFTPFFLARVFESTLAIRASGKTGSAAISAILDAVNDFVGYRPIAILETRPQTELYPHEKVCPIPLYFKDVGVAAGKYQPLLQAMLELLGKTDAQTRDEACLDLNRLDEIALDPRAIDHFHPMTKRPNVLFGEWDPHRLDTRGYFRRFVIKQMTIDSLLAYAWQGGKLDPEALFESAATLAGTTLMGTGICGNSPTYHDSTVTLATLVQKIARFRDQFYQTLLKDLPGPHGERLRAEAIKLKQPFGRVRQYLNNEIATERARHLQERRLAILFAAMGYPQAARSRAAVIPAPATRLNTEIRIRQTTAQFSIRNKQIRSVIELLDEAEDYLRRGIECGALIDPWNILGYQGLFPTFSDRADVVRDPRAEELILTVGRQFETYAQALAEAVAEGEIEIKSRLVQKMRQLANWWDQFATSTVSDLPRVVGGERAEAAEHVATALTHWQSGGASDPAFWRKHREAFTTPVAYAQVIEALLDQKDHRAALALLVTWLSESALVPLQDSSASFYRLALRWLQDVVEFPSPPLERGALVRRFFELMEANAEEFWAIPTLPGSAGQSDEFEEDEDEADRDDDDDTYASAYEGMTFRDSADDGEEGAVADGSGSSSIPGSFALDGEQTRLEAHLQFLAALAKFWRIAARSELWPTADDASRRTITHWLDAARGNVTGLVQFTQELYEVPIPAPLGGIDAATEFDSRRNIKGRLLESAVQTIVETIAAARSLGAVLPRPTPLPDKGGKSSMIKGSANWEPAAVQLERAVATCDRQAARAALPEFLLTFKHEPLLVCPMVDGGEPVQALRAQTAQQLMESLLARLPRLGMLRETFHLTKLARSMERNAMPEGRRVSSFDVLFRTAVTGTVDAILTASRDWGESANEDGPLAADLKLVADAYHKLWIEHSQTLRLSSLEVVLDRDEWLETVSFIKKYGSDLFTVRFLNLANLRGILGQGATEWLNRESEGDDWTSSLKLVEDWAGKTLDQARTSRIFEVILHSLVEHYDEYRDYNTTTTQSDYGDNLYILLDFLRLKVAYDRYAWRLRPMVLAHEVLCRRGYDRLAQKWREFVSTRMDATATELLQELAKREQEHGVRLRTIRDRLEERFVQPLQVDQAAARVARAAAAAREGKAEDHPAFLGLLATIKPLAEKPVGVGLDVPAWVRRLEDELRRVRMFDDDLEDDERLGTLAGFEQFPMQDPPPLDLEDFRTQIRDWDQPIS